MTFCSENSYLNFIFYLCNIFIKIQNDANAFFPLFICLYKSVEYSARINLHIECHHLIIHSFIHSLTAIKSGIVAKAVENNKHLKLSMQKCVYYRKTHSQSCDWFVLLLYDLIQLYNNASFHCTGYSCCLIVREKVNLKFVS